MQKFLGVKLIYWKCSASTDVNIMFNCWHSNIFCVYEQSVLQLELRGWKLSTVVFDYMVGTVYSEVCITWCLGVVGLYLHYHLHLQNTYPPFIILLKSLSQFVSKLMQQLILRTTSLLLLYVFDWICSRMCIKFDFLGLEWSNHGSVSIVLDVMNFYE